MKTQVAKRLRNSAKEASDGSLRETVVCGQCGQRFTFESDPAAQSSGVAAKQAAWVADQLVWDHIQERKHAGTMTLPNS